MRTSWRETQNIEDYIFDRLSPEDRILIETNIDGSVELKEKLQLQKQSYELIKEYGREVLRKEINAIDREVFSSYRHNKLRKRILKIFSNSK
ncbi:hypothetical protein [Membranihabitans maritimus]|uniref:hypothetical protein n=1 Tax=Membranihabitans maritimus TaxID=2904244 RepID=UPI001F26612C|nr:hypothetical protein [Membranihabitans maritimus]